MMKSLEREVDWLLREKYSCSRASDLKEDGLEKLKLDIERLKKGEPLDYVIGFTDFLGCKIDLSERPLIPRPETEFWTEAAVKDIKNSKVRKISCLDVFAGSGCIGVAVLKSCPEFLQKVDFAEKQDQFLKQIRINLKLNQPSPRALAWRSKIIKSDIFSKIRGKYDYIFANPPYIVTTRKDRIQKSVLNFEPKLALLGGKDGLFYIRKFLKDAKKHLKKGGRIYMEFDFVQKKEVEKILKTFGYNSFQFFRDQYGKWRYIVVS
ncbi:MAG: peptide chain release factor N(5)-glutamine methyltransferase [Candidatus Staskawiczbacteria bacterium]|nr:peptide chain release factor N(5)-glutamine methyltransferase [Candidatus Staskawiczbacteria bacterium]